MTDEFPPEWAFEMAVKRQDEDFSALLREAGRRSEEFAFPSFEAMMQAAKGPIRAAFNDTSVLLEALLGEREALPAPPWHRRRWNLLKWWWRSNLAWRFARHEPGEEW